MPELLLELFGEEIPARMQARGAAELSRLVGEALAALSPQGRGPSTGRVASRCAWRWRRARRAASTSERGPRVGAPEAALAGFLRKHGAAREALAERGGFWVLERAQPAREAAALVAEAMPALLRRFPWPKSMRWGGTSAFTWVRPLRRILCLLDGAVVPFDLRDGADDGHGLASGTLTEGHRFLAPGAFAVDGAAAWERGLLERRVVPDAAERRRRVAEGVAELAAARGLAVVPDAGLLDEVAGLVEWPVPLLGRIDAAFMDLPPEVMQVSMRVNQRYFALRDAEGGRRRSSPSPPTWRRPTAAPRSWPATSGCCGRASRTRGTSGTWTGARPSRTGWRRWRGWCSTRGWARRRRGRGASRRWRARWPRRRARTRSSPRGRRCCARRTSPRAWWASSRSCRA